MEPSGLDREVAPLPHVRGTQPAPEVAQGIAKAPANLLPLCGICAAWHLLALNEMPTSVSVATPLVLAYA